MANQTPPDELLAGLQDIRLPDVAPGGLPAEIAAAVGVGLMLAAALSLLIPLISRKVKRASEPSLQDRLIAARNLTGSERSVALLHLLRSYDPNTADGLRNRLYVIGDFPSVDELEDHLSRIETRHA